MALVDPFAPPMKSGRGESISPMLLPMDEEEEDIRECTELEYTCCIHFACSNASSYAKEYCSRPLIHVLASILPCRARNMPAAYVLKCRILGSRRRYPLDVSTLV
jgi:hypothetical protein